MSRSALRGASTLDRVTVTGTAIRSNKRCHSDEIESADMRALIAAYKEQGTTLSPRKARRMIAEDRAAADHAEDARTLRLDPLDPRVKVISWSDDTGERGAKHADGDLIWESEATADPVMDRETKRIDQEKTA